MTAYIANHRKKINMLLKREQEMRHAIEHDSSQDRLEKCAERVRLAQLAVLKLKFYRTTYRPVSEFLHTDEAISWIEMDVEKIINLYK